MCWWRSEDLAPGAFDHHRGEPATGRDRGHAEVFFLELAAALPERANEVIEALALDCDLVLVAADRIVASYEPCPLAAH